MKKSHRNYDFCANVARRIAKKLIGHTCLYSRKLTGRRRCRPRSCIPSIRLLENKEFEIYFQPKIRTTDQAVSSAGSSGPRIRDGKMLWSPDIYIPLFEQNGFVVDLTTMFMSRPSSGSAEIFRETAGDISAFP